jgi:uncharacterized protein DUF6636
MGRLLELPEGLHALFAYRPLSRFALVVGALAVLCVGCGGSNETRTTIVTVTNVSTVTSAAPQPTAHDYRRFQLPSKNIGCGFDSGVLRCDILSGLQPEPGQPCELDWTGIVLEADRLGQPQCAGDTIYDGSAPTLAYGETWSREGITCVSTRSGLDCQSAAGHGFKLARAAWRVF